MCAKCIRVCQRKRVCVYVCFLNLFLYFSLPHFLLSVFSSVILLHCLLQLYLSVFKSSWWSQVSLISFFFAGLGRFFFAINLYFDHLGQYFLLCIIFKWMHSLFILSYIILIFIGLTYKFLSEFFFYNLV